MTDDKKSFEQKIEGFEPKVNYSGGMIKVDIHLSELLKIGYQADKVIADQAKRIAELELTFKHIHSSIGTDGESCANCGLNIRDPIHERQQR